MRVGEMSFRVSIVSPSSNCVQRSLKASEALLSCVRANRVPICTPSAPKAMAASIDAPLPIPPAAIKGRVVAWRT